MTGKSSPKSSDALVGALLTASRVLVGVSAASLAEVEDALTLTQFRSLVVLDSLGPRRLNQLAEALAVNPSTAMRTIDKLVAAGMVQRSENPVDRREVVLELTAGGAEVVARVTERRRAHLRRIVSRMSPDRRDDLVAALTEFADAAGERGLAMPAAPLGW